MVLPITLVTGHVMCVAFHFANSTFPYGVSPSGTGWPVKRASSLKAFLIGLSRVRSLGVSRCGAKATAAMLDEFRRREAAGELNEKATMSGKLSSGDY